MQLNNSTEWLQKKINDLRKKRESIKYEDYRSRRSAGAAKGWCTRRMNQLAVIIEKQKRFV